MKHKALTSLVSVLSIAAVCASGTALASAADTTPEGVGGGVLNPTPWVANPVQVFGGGLDQSEHVGEPQFATWALHAPDSEENIYGIGANMSFWNRVELGVARNDVNFRDAVSQFGTNHVVTHDISAKVQLLNGHTDYLGHAWSTPWIPSVSVGAIYKETDLQTTPQLKGGSHDTGTDLYAVIGKSFDNMRIPWRVSAGVRYTRTYLNGIGGFGGGSRAHAWFGNIAATPLPWLTVGGEYREGTRVGRNARGVLENHPAWDAYVEWNATSNFSLKATYLYTGQQNWGQSAANAANPDAVGGEGMLSAQYAF